MKQVNKRALNRKHKAQITLETAQKRNERIFVLNNPFYFD